MPKFPPGEPIAPQTIQGETDVLVELRDSTGTVQNRLEAEIVSLQWSYQRIGGCGDFTAVIARPFDSLPGVTAGYDFRIHVKRPGTSSYDLWYGGLVQQVAPSLAEPEQIQINGIGYKELLSRFIFSNSYSVSDVSSAVVDIAGAAGSRMGFTVGSIDVTSVSITSVGFNNSNAFLAVSRLADLAGVREWGIDRNKTFFFLTRSTSLSLSLYPGANLKRFDQRDRFDAIVNNVTVEGAQSGGMTISVTVADSASQVQNGRRDFVVQAANLQSSADAQQLANSILTEEGNIRQEATAELAQMFTMVESKVPVGQVSIRQGEVLWGTKNWGQFRWGGTKAYQLNEVRYTLTDAGINATLTLEVGAPTLSLPIRQLRADLDSIRQRTF